MSPLWMIVLSTAIVSLISFMGLLALVLKKNAFKKILFIMVSFAAGSLLGAAFFDILPEVVSEFGPSSISYVLLGIFVFFVLEKYIHWHHCHKGDCSIKPQAYLNLIGDGIHNLIDGGLIAVSYLHSFHLGIITTLAVIFHEIPQELGDFAIIVHSGIKPRKALFYNFLSALIAVFGSVVTIFFASEFQNLIPFLLSVAGGGFIYLALVDIIPEIHKENDMKGGLIQITGLAFGLGLMYLIGRVLVH